MTHTDEGNTMMRLVAALHAHIAREEEERRRNPEAARDAHGHDATAMGLTRAYPHRARAA